MKWKPLALLLIQMVMACNLVAPGGGKRTNPSQLDYVRQDANSYALVGHVKQPELLICLDLTSGSSSGEWEENIRSVVSKWIKPMRALTADALVETINVTTQDANCDGYVTVRDGVWSHTYIQDNPVINMGNDQYTGSYNVLLHEFGHAFALGDTYQNGQSGDCQPGQPQAVMCNTSFADLQKDDIAGITRIFKSAYPYDKPGPVAAAIIMFLAVGKEISTDKYELAVAVIGAKAGEAAGKVEACFGVTCSSRGAGWKSFNFIETKDDASIFRSSDASTFSDQLSISVRYRAKSGEETIQKFSLKKT